MEEINLNYKDEASLESGSGRATEGREGGETAITPVLFLYFGRRFLLSFFFFSPFLFSPSSCGNEVACPPSSLACHPDTPPSLAHAQASYQLVSSVAAAGSDRTVGTTQSLLSSLHSLLTDNRCLGFSGNMRRLLLASCSLCNKIKKKKRKENPLPNLPELLANWKEISRGGGRDILQHAQTSSVAHKLCPAPSRASSSFLFAPTQKQINYTGWLPPLIYLMKSIWRLPLLTDIQASLVHLGSSTVMGTSCLVNKQACEHKMHCALHTVLFFFTGLPETEIMRIGEQQQEITYVVPVVAQVFVSQRV